MPRFSFRLSLSLSPFFLLFTWLSSSPSSFSSTQFLSASHIHSRLSLCLCRHAWLPGSLSLPLIAVGPRELVACECVCVSACVYVCKNTCVCVCECVCGACAETKGRILIRWKVRDWLRMWSRDTAKNKRAEDKSEGGEEDEDEDEAHVVPPSLSHTSRNRFMLVLFLSFSLSFFLSFFLLSLPSSFKSCCHTPFTACVYCIAVRCHHWFEQTNIITLNMQQSAVNTCVNSNKPLFYPFS